MQPYECKKLIRTCNYRNWIFSVVEANTERKEKSYVFASASVVRASTTQLTILLSTGNITSHFDVLSAIKTKEVFVQKFVQHE